MAINGPVYADQEQHLLTTDSGVELALSAVRVAHNLETDAWTFEEEVRVEAESWVLTCTELDASTGDGSLLSFEASGEIRLTGSGWYVEADLATYDATVNRLTISGSPSIWTREARLEGERVIVDLTDMTFEVIEARGVF